MFQCFAATNRFLDSGKEVWVRLDFDDAINLAHVLLNKL